VSGEGDERTRALDRAVRALARRDHSTESLRAKLEHAGISAQAQGEALERLAAAGYLDDARFAHDRARHLAGRGYGDDWIRADLDAQGVTGDAAEAALVALEPEAERAIREAGRLGNGPRAIRALQRRGFSDECVEHLLEGPLRATGLQE
jgi:regulatory protein